VSDYHDLMRQHGLIQQMAQERIHALRAADLDRQQLISQLLHFGVCPCIVQGRYSTCCAPKHGDLT
jgi:hypothetical protein